MLDSLSALPAQRPDRGARLAPRLDDFRVPAGPIRLPAAAEHRLRVHTGAPARGVCGRHAFVYTRGALDLVPAGASDEWCSDEPTDMLVITLPSVLVQRAAAELGRSEQGLDARCLFRDPSIEHIAWALDAGRSSGGGALYAESLGLALAYHLLSAYSSSTGGVTRDRRVFSLGERRRITEHVEAHLHQRLGLDALADTLGMSTSHFKVLFRRSLGLPVHEYVIQRRVERAKALLLEDELPAAEVALAAGFAHQSHMARCMRRVLGVTPSALRAAARA
jgi:AraC family transcriptional regulator